MPPPRLQLSTLSTHMPTIVHILNSSPATASIDPRLALYANLKDSRLRALEAAGGLGRFIAEGPLVVHEALIRAQDNTLDALTSRPPIRISSILIDQEAITTHADLLALAADDVPVYAAPAALLQSILGFDFHRGILACGFRPPDHDWVSLARDASTLIIMEDLANHDNVGSIFRTVAALAGPNAAVLVTPRSCDPLYRKSLRVSIGLCLRIPFARIDPWPESIPQLHALGYRICALTPSPQAVSLQEFARSSTGRIAIIVGAEGPGLCAQTLVSQHVKHVRIDMAPDVDSLNVGVAVGIALSHLIRLT